MVKRKPITEIEDRSGARQAESLFKSMVSMRAPWGRDLENRGVSAREGKALMQEGFTISELDLNKFVQERTGVHREYIAQNEKTKRTAMMVGCLTIIASSVVMTFAPTGRETLSHLIGFALLIVAAGAFGYGRIWFKGAGGEFRAGHDSSESKS